MSANNTLSLGLDIGTSGVRGICIKNNYRIVASARAGIQDSSREALRNPFNWKGMLNHVLADIGRQINPADVASISVDGQSGTVLLCDDEGGLFENTSLLYNDTPSEQTVNELTTLIGSCPATLGRAFELWKKLGQPEKFHVVHQADWIAGLFCGRFNQSDENNALKTGYSPLTKSWNFPQEKLPFNEAALPAVRMPSSLMGMATTDFSKSAGLSIKCRLVSGTTDGTAGFIAASGLQNLSAGTAVTSLGTTLVIKIVADKDIESAQFGVYSHKLMDVWVAGGASNSGAGTLLNYFSPHQLDELSRQIDPIVASPLNYYPLIVKGERFPVNDLEMVSRVEPRPDNDAEFLSGLFESIARIEKQAYETLDSLGAPYPTIIKTVGGGSHNEVWTKIRERILGVQVITAEQPSAAFGSALIAQFGSRKI